MSVQLMHISIFIAITFATSHHLCNVLQFSLLPDGWLAGV